ncbi:MAG: acetylglutamate kinase [Cytophagales bacterium]|nr:MAG: acetylglutamate kinase [Cytophagales bacterium]
MSKEKLYLVKIGGNVIDDEKTLHSFLADFSKIPTKKILVHGGGKIATEISKGLGVEAQMIEGRRVTDAETLKIVTMVYAGLINKNIVAKLQANNNNAIGLTGADANCILSNKRPLKNDIDYGFVGDIKNIDSKVLSLLISNNLNPVIAPITHDGNGNLLNTNADSVATSLAIGLSQEYEVDLVYCFELKGVLSDFEDKNSVISKIDFKKYQHLKNEGIISKGMIPKLDNSFESINNGVNRVIICQANDLLPIIQGENLGTLLVKAE